MFFEPNKAACQRDPVKFVSVRPYATQSDSIYLRADRTEESNINSI